MSDHYDLTEENFPDRRRSCQLSEGDLQAIADRAASIVEQRFYEKVGKSVVSKVLWLCGAAAVALVAWLHGKGLIKFPFGG
jgi:hypothetical protein